MAKENEVNTNEVAVSKTPKKDKFMADNFTDRQFTDDEEMYGQLSEDYADAKSNADILGKLDGALASNPKNADYLRSIIRGEDPVMRYLEEYGEDALAELQTEEGKKKAADAHKRYLATVAKNKELDDAYAANLKESQAMLDGFRAEGKYQPEQIDKALDLIQETYDGILQGKLTRNVLEMALNAVGHDADVKTAADEAEVRGRNANIQATRKKAGQGDGMPSVNGGSKPQKKAPVKDMGALTRTANTPSIWDR